MEEGRREDVKKGDEEKSRGEEREKKVGEK